jgi:hypothetical protein
MRNQTFSILRIVLLLTRIAAGQEEQLTAKIEASLTADGAFQAAVLITGIGARSGPCREAFSLCS